MKKRFTIITWLFLICLLTAYGIGCWYFQDHYYYGTTIDGVVYGCLTAEETEEQMFRRNEAYELHIAGRGQLEDVLTGTEAGLVFTPREELQRILECQIVSMWPLSFLETHKYELKDSRLLDEAGFTEAMAGLSVFQEKNIHYPTNARVSEYSEELKGYDVVPESEGTLIRKKLAVPAIREALLRGVTELDLSDSEYYIGPTVRSDDETLHARADALNSYTKLTFTYDMHGVELVIDGDQIHAWLEESDGGICVNEEAVREYVMILAKLYDTYKNESPFTTAKGEIKLLNNKQYGWQLDQEAEYEALLRLLEEKTDAYRSPVWTKTGYADGPCGIGSTYVEIDLTNQHLYVVENGSVILESDIVTGHAGRGWDTPPGIFRITYKTKNKILRGPGYASPVSYWMPFNGNIGMHDATWRGKFGGTIYQRDGSHGCVNLPLAKAKEIYNFVKTNMPVVCYY